MTNLLIISDRDHGSLPNTVQQLLGTAWAGPNGCFSLRDGSGSGIGLYEEVSSVHVVGTEIRKGLFIVCNTIPSLDI